MIFDHFAPRRAPEPRNRAGEILLSHNHICLLHALYDRPKMTAGSTADWVRAAVPYTRLFRQRPSIGCLKGSVKTMHHSWVKHRRPDRHHRWTLTRHGLAILELRAPAWIRGVGPYEGLRAFRDRTRPAIDVCQPVAFDPRDWFDKGWDDIDAWWAELRRTPCFVAIAERVDRMLGRWSALNATSSFNDDLLVRLPRVKVLRRYVLHFLMTQGALPSGEHLVIGPWAVAPFEVDFDALGE